MEDSQSKMQNNIWKLNFKLEQLECLDSENTPSLPHDYPHYWFTSDLFHSDSKLYCGGIMKNPWIK